MRQVWVARKTFVAGCHFILPGYLIVGCQHRLDAGPLRFKSILQRVLILMIRPFGNRPGMLLARFGLVT